MKKFFCLLMFIVILFSSCKYEKNEVITNPPEKKETIGAWINYKEIEAICDESETDEQFVQKVKEVISRLVQYSVNTIFLHVRAFDDSFYNSELFPVSRYCDDENGRLKFDVLKVFSEEGHKKGVEIHAWINPYRISLNNDINLLPKGYTAEKWYSDAPDNQRLIVCDNGIYYNPASLEAQKHIIDGVKEILENYEVDGIHFDDYFYPKTGVEIDSDFYNSYISSGGYLSLGDFRRENVSSLIANVYSTVKLYNENLIFSVSPTGSIENNFSGCFADVKKWAGENGYVDMIIPQLYYGFENSKYPFISLAEDWIGITGENVKLVLGLPLYKIGKEDKYAGDGLNEWKTNNDIISRQITYAVNNENIDGFVYYSASGIYGEPSNEILKEELENIRNVLISK